MWSPKSAFQLVAAGFVLALMNPGTLAGETNKGASLYKDCKRCHQIGAGAVNRIGPHLNDLFGRRAGTLEDFRYSRAMKAAGAGGLVWTGDSLDVFLANPRKMVPRSRMSFRGMKKVEDRSELIAWLQGFSSGHKALPAAEPTSTAAEYGLDPKLLAVTGDPEYGAYLASECTSCHRVDGVDLGIPSITGWPVDDFMIAMLAYKHGKRIHQAMQLVTQRLSSEEIAALAAHFRNLGQSQ